MEHSPITSIPVMAVDPGQGNVDHFAYTTEPDLASLVRFKPQRYPSAMLQLGLSDAANVCCPSGYLRQDTLCFSLYPGEVYYSDPPHLREWTIGLP